MLSACHIYFKDGEAVVEFSRNYASISKDVLVCTYYKQAMPGEKGLVFRATPYFEREWEIDFENQQNGLLTLRKC